MPLAAINPRKRLQQDSGPEPVSKKKRNTTMPPIKDSEVIRVLDDEEPSTFHIMVKLNSKFGAFPPKLCSRLTMSYKKTVLAQMDALHNHKPQKHSHDYTLLIGECTSSSPPAAGMAIHATTTPKTPHLSIANMQLLEAFVAKYGTSFKQGSFVELKTSEGMANREFINLHTVRNEDVGWGFDTYGCLSLYSARIEEKVLRRVVYFVERTDKAVKVEID